MLVAAALSPTAPLTFVCPFMVSCACMSGSHLRSRSIPSSCWLQAGCMWVAGSVIGRRLHSDQPGHRASVAAVHMLRCAPCSSKSSRCAGSTVPPSESAAGAQHKFLRAGPAAAGEAGQQVWTCGYGAKGEMRAVFHEQQHVDKQQGTNAPAPTGKPA
jgi:hypothetical protein